MPEIGQTLRETRLRNRVDITEVEAGTKIRAKYLRALENEEWDLLPGPTFVKTFLRSYADYLGLDSRLLVEEYKQRFERPSTMELTPFSPRGAAAGAGSASGAGAGSSARGSCVFVGIVALLGALYALGTWGGDDNGGRSQSAIGTATPTAHQDARPQEEAQGRGAHACHPADRAHRNRQRLPRRCERHGADQQRDPGGGPADPALSRQALPRHLRQRPGADALRRPDDRRPGPLDAGRLRAAAGQAPARAVRRHGGPPAREPARGHPHHRHRGAVRDHLRPQRAVAVRAPARARRRGGEHPDRGRPPRRHARRAGLHGGRGRWTSS